MSEHFNPELLQEVSGGDTDFEKELIETYIQELDKSLAALDVAIKSSDKPNCIHFAHDIKGSSANVGAEIVRSTSAKMELNAKSGDLTSLVDLYSQLVSESIELKKVLNDYVNSL